MPIHAQKCARTRRHRNGQTLAYLILVLFAIIGLGALVIDLAFARLTQRQMQSAVDTAALEGLRHRDSISDGLILFALDESDRLGESPTLQEIVENNCGLVNLGDPSWRDCAREYIRRWLASHNVAIVFDDDLDPTNAVMPVVEFIGGITDAPTASQTMVLSEYKPRLKINSNNEPSGDMAAGTYTRDADSTEQNDYTRVDFDYGIGNSAFLVRMRRSDEIFSPDSTSHSSGPTVPVLLGRGSVIDSSLLARGTVVRATAIADALPLQSVGAPIDSGVAPSLNNDVPGYSHLGVALNSWATLPLAVDKSAQMTAAGQIHTLAETSLVSVMDVDTIVVQSGIGFNSALGKSVQFHDDNLHIIRTLDTINGTTWTLVPDPSAPSITALDLNMARIAVREVDCGIHVRLTLLEDTAASDTEIRVNAGDDLLDPDNEPSMAFDVEIGNEVVALVDIDDVDPTLWTVAPPISSIHSAGAAVYVRNARVLINDVETSHSTINVKSLVRNVDPENHAAAKYFVVVGGEWMRVDDISQDSNGFPAIWNVTRPLPQVHLVDAPVHPPFGSFGTSGPGFESRYEAGIINGINKLASDISDSQTSLTVDGPWNAPDPDLDPTRGFTIRIGNEWIRVVDFDDFNQKLWTVERGYGNTNSNPHLASDDVLNASSILLGDALISAGGTQTPLKAAPVFSSLCPVYNQLANDRIVGFGLGTKLFDSTWDLQSGGYVGLSLKKVTSRIVSENASAGLVRQFAPDVPSSDVSQRSALFESIMRVLNRNFSEHAALAPVSAR